MPLTVVISWHVYRHQAVLPPIAAEQAAGWRAGVEGAQSVAASPAVVETRALAAGQYPLPQPHRVDRAIEIQRQRVAPRAIRK